LEAKVLDLETIPSPRKWDLRAEWEKSGGFDVNWRKRRRIEELERGDGYITKKSLGTAD